MALILGVGGWVDFPLGLIGYCAKSVAVGWVEFPTEYFAPMETRWMVDDTCGY